jgi:hypothetical protein
MPGLGDRIPAAVAFLMKSRLLIDGFLGFLFMIPSYSSVH